MEAEGMAVEAGEGLDGDRARQALEQTADEGLPALRILDRGTIDFCLLRRPNDDLLIDVPIAQLGSHRGTDRFPGCAIGPRDAHYRCSHLSSRRRGSFLGRGRFSTQGAAAIAMQCSCAGWEGKEGCSIVGSREV